MGIGLVFEADLHSSEHISHWVLQGVCLILNTDWSTWWLTFLDHPVCWLKTKTCSRTHCNSRTKTSSTLHVHVRMCGKGCVLPVSFHWNRTGFDTRCSENKLSSFFWTPSIQNSRRRVKPAVYVLSHAWFTESAAYHSIINDCYYLLPPQRGYVFASCVTLFVCPSVGKISQKVWGWSFMTFLEGTELEIRTQCTASSCVCLRPLVPWSCCDLDLWPCGRKHWRLHLSLKLHQCWKFGESQPSNFQDIALTRPKITFSACWIHI